MNEIFSNRESINLVYVVCENVLKHNINHTFQGLCFNKKVILIFCARFSLKVVHQLRQTDIRGGRWVTMYRFPQMHVENL
jgi:hypothetical protein